jgi:hypothetical protein
MRGLLWAVLNRESAVAKTGEIAAAGCSARMATRAGLFV